MVRSAVVTEDGRPVLRIQTVLYLNSQREIWSLSHSLGAAARAAVASGRVGAVTWAIGDCSPSARLGDEDVDLLRAHVLDGGLAAFSYEFFDANLGSSGGHNRLCAAEVDGDYVMTLNPDTYVSPRTLVELLAALDDPSVGVAEARQLPLEHPKAYDPVTGDTSWASTCCILVRRAVFDAAGGFDHDHFPLYCDDVDFSWRVRLAGHRVVVAPNAVVFHDKRPATDGRWVASDTEVFHSTLGRLMLGTRYGRPDIVEETVAWITKAGHPKQQEALREFRTRASAGRVPTPVDGADAVAQFVNGEYAVHRF